MIKYENKWFTRAIDILIVLYTISIFILSFDEALNSYSRLLAFLLMGILAFYVLLTGVIKGNSVIYLFAGFTAWGGLSCLWAVDSSEAWSKTMTLIQLLALFWLLYNYLSREKKLDFFMQTLCFSSAVFSVYVVLSIGVFAYFSGVLGGDRMGVEAVNLNTIGISTAAAAIVSIWYVFYKKRVLHLVSAVICALVCVGSGSRTAWILLLVGVIMLFILKANTKKRLGNLLQCVVALAAIAVVLQLPMFSGLSDRIADMMNAFTKNGTTDGSTEERLGMISLGMQQFFKTPIHGIGLGNSGVLTEAYFGETYLHNNFVELLACVGIVGFFLYYGMFLVPLVKLGKRVIKGNTLAIVAVVLLVAQLVSHFGAVEYYSKIQCFYILMCVLIVQKVEVENESNLESIQAS